MSWSVKLRARLGALCVNLALEAQAGPTVIVGPNGAGKTTLLRMIAGAYPPQSGVIRIGVKEVFDSSVGLNVPPEERRVGYVPQGFGLFPHLRAVDNVAFGLSLGSRRRPLDERRDAARTLLAELDCEHLADRLPRRLSGGEQQRVALARALIVEPELLLLDEPLATLDPSSRRKLRRFLADHLTEQGRPAIVVTHDLRDAQALGADIVVLEDGKITQRGSIPELRSQPATAFIEDFFRVDSAMQRRP
jgi:ABC-type sulfate/molybdate transport systems ATPase subunit